MIDIKAVVSGIIYGEDSNFCGLCWKRDHQNMVGINDDVILNTKSLSIMDLIAIIISEHHFKYYSSFIQWICSNCMRSLISCYNFIEMCQEASRRIHRVIDNFYSFLEKNNNIIMNCKTLHINMDTEGNIEDMSSRGNLQKLNLAGYVIESRDFDQTSIQSTEHETKSKLKKNIKLLKVKDLRDKDDQSSYKCKFCHQTYSRGQNLVKHYYRTHVPKKHKCNICPRRYGTYLMLKDHINTSHSKAVCSHCGKVYKSKLSLISHEKSHIVRHTCESCGKVYKTNISFRRHIASLCGRNKNSDMEEKFICDHCGKKYVQKSGLRVHIQFEHGNCKGYICEWCNKKCNSISKWKEHIVTHTKEKKFKCDICNGTFVTKKSLLYHTRTHTGEKPYKCMFCDQSFLSASRRSTHVKYHHMPAVAECDVCNKKFKGKAYLLKHRKRHLDPNSRLHSGI